MSRSVALLVCLGWGLAALSTARAEVADADKHGFTIKIERSIEAPSKRVYEVFVGEVGKWWHPNHTYSLDSSNLYIEARPKGWFGEKLLGGGFVRHMEIVFLAPNKSLRMLGGLGPLQQLGTQGAMTLNFKTEGETTQVQLVYAVAGYSPAGLDKLAPAVDSVLQQQLDRLKSYVETGKP